MPKQAPAILSAILLLQSAGAGAQTRTEPPANEPQAPNAQVLYKGVVGNLLEAMPLEPENRVQLQRLNAVVSNPLSAHSLAVALGIASPPLVLVGLIWGFWSAKQIQTKDTLAERARTTSNAAAPLAHGLSSSPLGAQQGGPTAVAPSPGRRAPGAANPLALALEASASDDPAQAVTRFVDAGALATVVGAAPGPLAPASEPSPSNSGQAVVRFVDAGALATLAGGANGIERPVPCDTCYMPMLYPRVAPGMR